MASRYHANTDYDTGYTTSYDMGKNKHPDITGSRVSQDVEEASVSYADILEVFAGFNPELQKAITDEVAAVGSVNVDQAKKFMQDVVTACAAVLKQERRVDEVELPDSVKIVLESNLSK